VIEALVALWLFGEFLLATALAVLAGALALAIIAGVLYLLGYWDEGGF
jgi:hypothetical protein